MCVGAERRRYTLGWTEFEFPASTNLADEDSVGVERRRYNIGWTEFEFPASTNLAEDEARGDFKR